MTAGCDQFHILAVDEDSGGVVLADATFDDNFDGTYQCGVQPQSCGVFSIHIKLYGVHIIGSPFELDVVADEKKEKEKKEKEKEKEKEREDDVTMKKRRELMVQLKRQEMTRRRAQEALKRAQRERKADEERERRRKKQKRCGGGFVVSFVDDDVKTIQKSRKKSWSTEKEGESKKE